MEAGARDEPVASGWQLVARPPTLPHHRHRVMCVRPPSRFDDTDDLNDHEGRGAPGAGQRHETGSRDPGPETRAPGSDSPVAYTPALLAPHQGLDLVRVCRQISGEILVAVGGDQVVVLDPHSERLVWDVDARLVGHHHAGLEWRVLAHRVVGVEAEVVPETVNEVLTEPATAGVAEFRFLERTVGDLAHLRHGNTRFEGVSHPIMGLEHQQVDLALARAEAAVGWKGPGYTIPAHIVPKYFHKRGMIGVPRKPDTKNSRRRSDGSQYYIVSGRLYTDSELDDIEKENNYKFTAEQRRVYKTIGGAPHLDGSYTVFGEVTSGMNVVDLISKVETDKDFRPVTDIRVKRITIIK